MTAPIKVTVEGEPVTAEVTWGQVRAYLRARGWEHMTTAERVGEMWARGDLPHGHMVWVGGEGDGEMPRTVSRIARFESRHPSAALRDIARIDSGRDELLRERALLPPEVLAGAPQDSVHRDPPGARPAATIMTVEGRGLRFGGLLTEHRATTPGCPDVDRVGAGARAEAAPLTEEELRLEIVRLRAQHEAQREQWALNVGLEVMQIRAAVGAHKDEATVDAVRRVVAISEAWRELAEARHDAEIGCKCTLEVMCSACQREAAAEEKIRKLRTLGVDPDA